MVTLESAAIRRVARRRPARLIYLLMSLGASFGFVAVVAAVAYASWFRLPAGVADGEYVSQNVETLRRALGAVDSSAWRFAGSCAPAHPLPPSVAVSATTVLP